MLEKNRINNNARTIVLIIILTFIVAGLEANEGPIFKLKVKTPNANIRIEPSLTGKIVLQAPQGAILEADQKQGEWYRIVLPQQIAVESKYGYLHQSVIEVLEEINEGVPEKKQDIDIKKEEGKEIIRQGEVGWVIQDKQKKGVTSAKKKSTAGVFSQLKGGLLIGTGFSSLGMETDNDTGSVLGFQLGGFISFKLNDYLELHPEIAFVKKGGKEISPYGSTIYNYIYRINYIELPILAKLSFPLNKTFSPFIAMGPFGAIRIGDKLIVERIPASGTPSETEYEADFKLFDFGLAMGGGINLKLGEKANIHLEIRYSFGLFNSNYVFDYYTVTGTKTQNLTLLLGLSLL